jgi:hypothetical protein
MRLYILLFFLSCLNISWSQSGNVTIVKDERIENIIKSKSQIIPPATSPQISGYRVQLVFDSNKKIVDDARSKFVSSNTKIDTYILYNAPNFILKVGDFRTKIEADRLKDAMMRDFPTCFVVKEMINLPRID